MTKTLADTLAARETVYVNCGHAMCCKSTRLDISALIGRLGPGHGSMHWDLVWLFACSLGLQGCGTRPPSGLLHVHSWLPRPTAGAQSRREANVAGS